MKIIFTVMIALGLLGGCTTTKPDMAILEQYRKTTITLPIIEEQAKLIAQKELVDIALHRQYTLTEPTIMKDFEGVGRQELFWFVAFNEISRSTIPTVYMIVIEKSTGKIKFSKSYVLGKEWILEAALNGHMIKK